MISKSFEKFFPITTVPSTTKEGSVSQFSCGPYESIITPGNFFVSLGITLRFPFGKPTELLWCFIVFNDGLITFNIDSY